MIKLGHMQEQPWNLMTNGDCWPQPQSFQCSRSRSSPGNADVKKATELCTLHQVNFILCKFHLHLKKQNLGPVNRVPHRLEWKGLSQASWRFPEGRGGKGIPGMGNSMGKVQSKRQCGKVEIHGNWWGEKARPGHEDLADQSETLLVPMMASPVPEVCLMGLCLETIPG